MTASAVQVTTCATTCRCLAASERTSSSLSLERASMCATIRSRDHAAKRVRRIVPSTSSTITSRLPRAHRVTGSSGAIAPINLALPSCDDAGRATKRDEMLRHPASLRPPGRCTWPAAAHGRQTDRSPYPLIGGLCPPPGSGRRRHGPNLDKQAQHIRLGEPLDDTIAAEMQDGDAGQRDGRSARGYAHELGVAIFPSSCSRSATFPAAVPAMLFTRVRHRSPGRITRYPSAYFTCCGP